MQTTPHALSLGTDLPPYTRQLSILYDVQRYTHRSWRDLWQIPSSLPPRTANRLILARLGDDLPPPADTLIASVPALCLLHWEHLPSIAYLLGAYMLRDALIQTGRVTMLPRRAADFLHLPLSRQGLRDNVAVQSRLQRDGLSDDLLYAIGAALLASVWLRIDGDSRSVPPLMQLTPLQDTPVCVQTPSHATLSFNRAIYQRWRLLFPESSLRAYPQTPLHWDAPSGQTLFLIKTAISHWNVHVQKDCFATG